MKIGPRKPSIKNLSKLEQQVKPKDLLKKQRYLVMVKKELVGLKIQKKQHITKFTIKLLSELILYHL